MTVSLITISITPQGVATITLNRPEMRNALNAEMIGELIDAFKTAIDNPKVRAIELSGEGKIFCAGADMNWMRSMADYTYDENVADATRLATLFETIDSCPKPILAVIQGGAYGGGVGLVAACDIAIAADDTSFCMSEVRVGILPAVISPYLIQAMGERQARRFTLTAERFSTAEALLVGLIHHAVPQCNLESAAQSILDQILKGSPQGQSASKKLFQELRLATSLEECRHLTTTAIAKARTSQDGQEGLQAFLNKRDPQWSTK